MTLHPFGPVEAARRPPCNIDAEQALLGILLYDNGAGERLADQLKAAHFFEPFHGRLFAAVQSHIRAGRLAEPILMADQFQTDPAFQELGALRYLADLVDRAPPAANAAEYARVIHDLALRRELIRISGETALTAQAGDADLSARGQIEAAELKLYSLAETGAASLGLIEFDDALSEALEMAAQAYGRDGGLSGLSTGLIDLDRMLGGLHPSDLIVLAARPGMGKTALGANIAFHVARHHTWRALPDGSRETVDGGVVAFFSLEMSAAQLAMRLLADVAEVPSDRIRKGEISAVDFGRIRGAAQEIGQAPLYIDATGGIAIAKLAARARRLKRTVGLDLIVIDYIQLITTGEGGRLDNRVQEVSLITGALKALAKELSVPVLALAQLSRQVELRVDKTPQLSDLRESGSIEQDADVVMFIYREAYYLGNPPPEGTAKHLEWQEKLDATRHLADVIIGKQRHGPTGVVRLHFNGEMTKFSNLR
jgi:replicative DNA helicase